MSPTTVGSGGNVVVRLLECRASPNFHHPWGHMGPWYCCRQTSECLERVLSWRESGFCSGGSPPYDGYLFAKCPCPSVDVGAVGLYGRLGSRCIGFVSVGTGPGSGTVSSRNYVWSISDSSELETSRFQKGLSSKSQPQERSWPPHFGHSSLSQLGP